MRRVKEFCKVKMKECTAQNQTIPAINTHERSYSILHLQRDTNSMLIRFILSFLCNWGQKYDLHYEMKPSSGNRNDRPVAQ